jgi:hypothetical protein
VTAVLIVSEERAGAIEDALLVILTNGERKQRSDTAGAEVGNLSLPRAPIAGQLFFASFAFSKPERIPVFPLSFLVWVIQRARQPGSSKIFDDQERLRSCYRFSLMGQRLSEALEMVVRQQPIAQGAGRRNPFYPNVNWFRFRYARI